MARWPIRCASAPLIPFAALVAATLFLSTACSEAKGTVGKRVIVLGVDGMDWEITRRLMERGELPNFSRLAAMGSSAPLGTAVPPLSPVAWSDFITGMDAGGHGIFDFIHRDPETMIPYLSTTHTPQPESHLKLGKYCIPTDAAEPELLRRGTPFWEVLDEAGVRTSVIRIPANYPPTTKATRELSGMGTPDLLGTYGIFSFYTSELFFENRDVSGGEVYELDLWEDRAEGTLHGPPNSSLCEREELTVDFTVYFDAEHDVAKLTVGAEERILRVGEWSDWVTVEFDLMPTQKLRGIFRAYLRSLRPEVELYLSPLNFDPLAPALPISHPESFAAELAERSGRFYTQGMPEDTQALRQGIFTPEEFLAQARIAGDEIRQQWEPVLADFQDGLLFYYFGNLDLVSHMMFRSTDPEHPAYDPEIDPQFADVVYQLYRNADEVVGYTLDHMPEDATLVVMSDHGFASWRRAFNLNRWLLENGYLALENPDLEKDPGLFQNVDWANTRAYGIGFNGLYVNLRGRERNGIVNAYEKLELLEELAAKLEAVVDPATGEPAITRTYISEKYFQDRGQLAVGPDMIVGYAEGTRGDDDSALGSYGVQVFSDNEESWSGDHGMDHTTVPGVLFTNRPLTRPAASLRDLAASILAEFGVEEFPEKT